MAGAGFRADLAARLAAGPVAAIAERLVPDFAWLVALPPAGEARQPVPPPLGALGIFLGARALLRSGREAQAWPWIEAALDAYAAAHPPGHRARHAPLGDALGAYTNGGWV